MSETTRFVKSPYNDDMETKLVTVATFDEGPRARLAQNVLREAGIDAVVTDESLIGMDWLMSNAVGGVKVQVREADVERAVEVLNDTLGSEDPTDLQRLEEEAVAAPPEDEPPEEPDAADEPEPATEAGSREDYARRMVFTAILSVFFPFIAFYSLYLWMNAVFAPGSLSARGRINLWIGGGLTLTSLLFIAWILEWVF